MLLAPVLIRPPRKLDRHFVESPSIPDMGQILLDAGEHVLPPVNIGLPQGRRVGKHLCDPAVVAPVGGCEGQHPAKVAQCAQEKGLSFVDDCVVEPAIHLSQGEKSLGRGSRRWGFKYIVRLALPLTTISAVEYPMSSSVILLHLASENLTGDIDYETEDNVK